MLSQRIHENPAKLPGIYTLSNYFDVMHTAGVMADIPAQKSYFS